MRTLVLTVVMALFTVSAFAAEEGYLNSRPIVKGRRGLINVATAPLEIPNQFIKEWNQGETRPIRKTVCLFGSLFKGVAYTVGRLGSGLWDIVTLNLDIPGNSEPLMKPDYVWSNIKE